MILGFSHTQLVVRDVERSAQWYALVLGTQAQVLGRDASPLAGEIVSQLMEKNDGKSDLGVTLRRVRCRMFARGYLLALCLVALGDSAWQLAPSSATP